ncbi:sulfatase-like hydrolase/transferase [Haloferula helveola]
MRQPLLTPIVALFVGLLALSNAAGAEPERPNVVVILIDDLSHYGVTAYGANRIRIGDDEVPQTISTPHIDRLADGGLLCENAFAYPLCEPTRIALMSGQLNGRNFLAPKSQHASDITFGDVFKRAGYATGIFGKWKQTRGTREIKGKDYIREFGWDEFCCFDVVGEGQRFLAPNLVTDGVPRDYGKGDPIDPKTGRRWYGPDICQRHALDFIERHRERPFLLYLPFMLVHDPHQPTPDTRPPERFDEFREWQDRKANKKGDDLGFLPDMVAYMDRQVGEVVAAIERLGLRERTLFIVMGDNGTKENFTHILPDGGDYRGGKGDTKDNGTHVPLVLSWPGTIPGGTSYEGLVDVTDIYPTMCDAAGLEIPNPRSIDGISFWPHAIGKPGEAREVIYTWYNANRPGTDTSKLIRYAFTKDFKRYAPHANFPEGRFFDLREDPLEESGEHSVKVAWWHKHHSGLDTSSLTNDQREAYRSLGAVLDRHHHVPVKSLEVIPRSLKLEEGASTLIRCRITPENATRQNLIWESGNPEVATVDKFGMIHAIAPGTTEITVYSWDDARPLADNRSETFSRDGFTDRIVIEVD